MISPFSKVSQTELSCFRFSKSVLYVFIGGSQAYKGVPCHWYYKLQYTTQQTIAALTQTLEG